MQARCGREGLSVGWLGSSVSEPPVASKWNSQGSLTLDRRPPCECHSPSATKTSEEPSWISPLLQGQHAILSFVTSLFVVTAFIRLNQVKPHKSGYYEQQGLLIAGGYSRCTIGIVRKRGFANNPNRPSQTGWPGQVLLEKCSKRC